MFAKICWGLLLFFFSPALLAAGDLGEVHSNLVLPAFSLDLIVFSIGWERTELGILHFVFSSIIFLIILWSLIKEPPLWIKCILYTALAIMTIGTLLIVEGDVGKAIVDHTYRVDYIQFIVIPLVAIIPVGLQLFKLKEMDKISGWFLWLTPPILGNFGTTWMMVALGSAMSGTMVKKYGVEKALLLLITVVILEGI